MTDTEFRLAVAAVLLLTVGVTAAGVAVANLTLGGGRHRG